MALLKSLTYHDHPPTAIEVVPCAGWDASAFLEPGDTLAVRDTWSCHNQPVGLVCHLLTGGPCVFLREGGGSRPRGSAGPASSALSALFNHCHAEDRAGLCTLSDGTSELLLVPFWGSSSTGPAPARGWRGARTQAGGRQGDEAGTEGEVGGVGGGGGASGEGGAWGQGRGWVDGEGDAGATAAPLVPLRGFLGYACPLASANWMASLLWTRRLPLIFDLDETLLVARSGSQLARDVAWAVGRVRQASARVDHAREDVERATEAALRQAREGAAAGGADGGTRTDGAQKTPEGAPSSAVGLAQAQAELAAAAAERAVRVGEEAALREALQSLNEYIASDTVTWRGERLRAVPELAYGEDPRGLAAPRSLPIRRPVVRVPNTSTLLTRIDPRLPNTSMIFTIRPGWHELRAFVTGREDVPGTEAAVLAPGSAPGAVVGAPAPALKFEVFVCTAAKREYALEAWRVLDPDEAMVPLELRAGRITCAQRKGLAGVLRLRGATAAAPRPDPSDLALLEAVREAEGADRRARERGRRERRDETGRDKAGRDGDPPRDEADRTGADSNGDGSSGGRGGADREGGAREGERGGPNGREPGGDGPAVPGVGSGDEEFGGVGDGAASGRPEAGPGPSLPAPPDPSSPASGETRTTLPHITFPSNGMPLAAIVDDRLDVWEMADRPQVLRVLPLRPYDVEDPPSPAEMRRLRDTLEDLRRRTFQKIEADLRPAARDVFAVRGSSPLARLPILADGSALRRAYDGLLCRPPWARDIIAELATLAAAAGAPPPGAPRAGEAPPPTGAAAASWGGGDAVVPGSAGLPPLQPGLPASRASAPPAATDPRGAPRAAAPPTDPRRPGRPADPRRARPRPAPAGASAAEPGSSEGQAKRRRPSSELRWEGGGPGPLSDPPPEALPVQGVPGADAVSTTAANPRSVPALGDPRMRPPPGPAAPARGLQGLQGLQLDPALVQTLLRMRGEAGAAPGGGAVGAAVPTAAPPAEGAASAEAGAERTQGRQRLMRAGYVAPEGADAAPLVGAPPPPARPGASARFEAVPEARAGGERPGEMTDPHVRAGDAPDQAEAELAGELGASVLRRKLPPSRRRPAHALTPLPGSAPEARPSASFSPATINKTNALRALVSNFPSATNQLRWEPHGRGEDGNWRVRLTINGEEFGALGSSDRSEKHARQVAALAVLGAAGYAVELEPNLGPGVGAPPLGVDADHWGGPEARAARARATGGGPAAAGPPTGGRVVRGGYAPEEPARPGPTRDRAAGGIVRLPGGRPAQEEPRLPGGERREAPAGPRPEAGAGRAPEGARGPWDARAPGSSFSRQDGYAPPDRGDPWAPFPHGSADRWPKYPPDALEVPREPRTSSDPRDPWSGRSPDARNAQPAGRGVTLRPGYAAEPLADTRVDLYPPEPQATGWRSAGYAPEPGQAPPTWRDQPPLAEDARPGHPHAALSPAQPPWRGQAKVMRAHKAPE